MRVITLMYHDVVPGEESGSSGFAGPGADRYKLSPEDFGIHLECLSRQTAARPASIFEILKGSQEAIPLVLTFDDGGLSAHTYVADMLEYYGWHGHFFVTTDRIGTSSFMDTNQIRDLHARGHIIGSHSRTHPDCMSLLDPITLLDEWTHSIQRLSDITGKQVSCASVPGGFYSKEIARAASAAGIEALFTSEPTTCCHHVEECLVLGRFTVMRGMRPEIVAALAVGDRIQHCKQAIGWTVKKAAKRLGGSYYLKLRKVLLRRFGAVF